MRKVQRPEQCCTVTERRWEAAAGQGGSVEAGRLPPAGLWRDEGDRDPRSGGGDREWGGTKWGLFLGDIPELRAEVETLSLSLRGSTTP